MSRERLQFERRRDPYPWTWEPWVFAALVLVTALALGVQVGRALANFVAGAGWTWPSHRQVVVSIVDVLRGDSAAGLIHPQARLAGDRLVYGSIAVTDAAIVIAFVGIGYWILTAWGPWRVLGMATKTEAEKLLGRQRLRHASLIVRPDLYAIGRDRGPVRWGVGAYVDSTAGEGPLGFRFGLNKRHAVEGQDTIPGKTRRW